MGGPVLVKHHLSLATFCYRKVWSKAGFLIEWLPLHPRPNVWLKSTSYLHPYLGLDRERVEEEEEKEVNYDRDTLT